MSVLKIKKNGEWVAVGTGAEGKRGNEGNGIANVELVSGNHAPGTYDIYRITFTDGETYDYQVYNGANGEGAGDMLTTIYDPQGKATDVFGYVDKKMADLTVPVQSVNGKTGAVSLSASDVGAPTTAEMNAAIAAIPTPDVSGQIAEHNVDPEAHNDIRLFLDVLNTRINTIADSDDTTLDQMSELVAYIKDNRELIEQVTTGKVSVSDIIDNLTTNVSNKPLSAAQGVALKALADTVASAASAAQSKADAAATAAANAQTTASNAASAAATAQSTADSKAAMEQVNEAIAAALGGGAKVEMVSYVGTGTYGANNPCSLTFSYAPKLLIWVGRKYNDNGQISPPTAGADDARYTSFIHSTQQLTTSYVSGAGFCDSLNAEQCYGKISEDGKTYFWYTTKGANQQLNNTAYTYYFVAIG